MSQSGIVDIQNSNPMIPLEFDADVGSAMAIANVIVISGGDGIHTSASGNEIVIDADIATAGPDAGSATKGIASFDESMFTVTDGFVQLSGSGSAIDSIGVQTGTSPIVPDSNGLVTINGALVTAGTYPVRSNGTGANTLAIEVQKSQAIAAPDESKVGLCNFDSSNFSVDGLGFVSINGSGLAETITGDDSLPISPTDGNWNILGQSTPNTSGIKATKSGTDLALTMFSPFANGDFTFQNNTAATPLALNVYNTDSNSASTVAVLIASSGADPFLRVGVPADQSYAIGEDTSDSKSFKITFSPAYDATPSSANVMMRSSTAGAITFPSNTVSCTGGNFDVTKSNNGSATTSTVSNTSNTASSNAVQQVTVAGTSAGDPQTTYTVTGGSTWSVGARNDFNDSFTISASSDLATSTWASVNPSTLNASFGGDVAVTRSQSGGTVKLSTINTSNTASSHANNVIQSAGTSAGDAFTTYTVSGATNWSEGIDNSDSDAYVLAASSALGTTNVMRAATTGEVNLPLQPSFLAYLSGAALNVTGDGTTYKVAFDSESHDINSDFDTTTYTFTAPVTGRYLFCVTISCSGLTASHNDLLVQLVTTTISNIQLERTNPSSSISGVQNCYSGSIVIQLTAGNTAYVNFVVNGGTKVVDVAGSTVGGSLFSGQLLS